MRKIDISYNNQSGASFGVFLYDYPVFSGGARNYTTTSVPGRRGQLVSTDNYQENIQIACTFSVISEELLPSMRSLKKWLCGTGQLTLNEEPDLFYKVLKIVPGDIEREIRKYGRFSVTFFCDPYAYTLEGQNEVDSIFYNPYDLSHPIYTITGNGTCTLTVNGQSITVNVGQQVTIDTDRMLTYRSDGTLQNSALTGDYESLYFPSGEINIQISAGFSVSIVPNWGYEV